MAPQIPDAVMGHEADPEVQVIIQAAAERRADRIVVLDMRGLSSVADWYVVMGGRSTRQVAALAEHLVDAARERGHKPLAVEGLAGGHWVLVDFGNVIVHVFLEEVRAFYDLEGLWAEAPRFEITGDEDGQ